MMDFFRRFFGTNGTTGNASKGDPNGVYFYVQPKGCEEIVRVRLDRNNDPSLADDGKTYWARKSVRGVKCRQTAELTVYFDSSRKMSGSEVENGALVDEAAYEAWRSAPAK
jgi:hypothetical protein